MSTTLIHEELTKFKAIFEPYLQSRLSEFQNEAKTYNPEFRYCLDEIVRLTMLPGAKRVRPFLVKIGHELFDGLECDEHCQNEILTVGCALELFHTFALIHDDIIDEAELRRGEPTIETGYKKYFAKNPTLNLQTIDHYARSGAILAGDLALSLADRLINEIRSQDLRKFYYQMQFELIAGQIDDCFGVGLSDLDGLESDKIYTMIAQKSGNYSIQKPLLMGALLADLATNSEYYQKMEKIGYDIGLVFQLTDDMLGLFGEQAETGKSTSSDIIEGKRTLLIHETYHSLDQDDKSTLKSILGNHNSTSQDMEWVKEKVRQTGALESIQKNCQNRVGAVQEILRQYNGTTNPHSRAVISSMCEYLLNRRK